MESQNASLYRELLHPAIWQGARTWEANGAIYQEAKGLFTGTVLWRKREGRGRCKQAILYEWPEQELGKIIS